jgi:hypothetical protein
MRFECGGQFRVLGAWCGPWTNSFSCGVESNTAHAPSYHSDNAGSKGVTIDKTPARLADLKLMQFRLLSPKRCISSKNMFQDFWDVLRYTYKPRSALEVGVVFLVLS